MQTLIQQTEVQIRDSKRSGWDFQGGDKTLKSQNVKEVITYPELNEVLDESRGVEGTLMLGILGSHYNVALLAAS